MRQLLYVSNTSREFASAELSEIVSASRIYNAARGITGVLLYCEGGFLQVLEGAHDSVSKLYEKIARDPRHWNSTILLDRQAPRVFESWSMGFKKVIQEDGKAFEIARDATLDRKMPPDLTVMMRTFLTLQG